MNEYDSTYFGIQAKPLYFYFALFTNRHQWSLRLELALNVIWNFCQNALLLYSPRNNRFTMINSSFTTLILLPKMAYDFLYLSAVNLSIINWDEKRKNASIMSLIFFQDYIILLNKNIFYRRDNLYSENYKPWLPNFTI